VLHKLIDLSQSSLDAQVYGIDQDTLASGLFGGDFLPQEGQNQATFSAISELKMLGLVHEVGEGSTVWEVTEAGRRHAKAMRLFWRDICAVELNLSEHHELLQAINRLSQQTTDQYAWLEYVEYDALASELAWGADWPKFRAAAFRLVDLGFAAGEFYSQSVDLRATYRGLVWDTHCVKSKVFVSYRRAPSESYALLLSEKLSPYGMSVFVDTLTVEGAEPFPTRIEQGIADCDIFVCLLAPSTLDSEWVLREIQKADELGKAMIPVFQPDFTPPDSSGLSEPIAKLLAFEGVKINSGYVGAAIDKLAGMIEQTWFKQFSG
jgi:hypothetical protein